MSKQKKVGESMSIENQRIILRKFAEENGGIIVDEYIDDGWSGTDFERPGIKRQLYKQSNRRKRMQYRRKKICCDPAFL